MKPFLFLLWVVFIGIMIGLGLQTVEARRGSQRQCFTDIECCEMYEDCDE